MGYYFIKEENEYYFSRQPGQEGASVSVEEACLAERLYFLNQQPLAAGRGSFCLDHPALLLDWTPDVTVLNRSTLDQRWQQAQEQLPSMLLQKIVAGAVQSVPLQAGKPMLQLPVGKKRVHLLAMGDVGSTVLLGLALLGGEDIETIGIYDFQEGLCRRWEHELNQVAYPGQYDRIPQVVVLRQEELFACDVFVFCASKQVPVVGTDVDDVRMAQLEANRAIIAQYGQMARQQQFRGLFAVVSDPVDQLCQWLLRASNTNEQGKWDGQGLRPEQIRGYGLGVMNGRAAYYAKQDEQYAQFLTEGRAYGPHGQQLVIADSISNYDHEKSLALTKLAVEANLKIRELGYKPYIAPALSSAAISILLTLQGQWHYSSTSLGGFFMGARNRLTACGTQLESLPLPDLLVQRLQQAEKVLRSTS